MNDIVEKMFFFKGSNKNDLLGFLHLPLHNRSNVGLLYCHPFAEEKNCSHVVSVEAARQFAKEGYPVFRFDLSGCGDSGGELRDFILDDWISDIKNALNCLKLEAKVEKIGLWGLRTGAALAMLFSEGRDDIAFALLWQPVFDLKLYIQQFIRQQMSTEIISSQSFTRPVKSYIKDLKLNKKIEIFGYELTYNIYESFINFGNIIEKLKVQFPIIIISISNFDNPSLSITTTLDKLNSNNLSTHFAHVVTEPFWDRYWQWHSPKVIECSISFLKSIGNGQ
jgi:exosortase A-associated hydrolase 2